MPSVSDPTSDGGVTVGVSLQGVGDPTQLDVGSLLTTLSTSAARSNSAAGAGPRAVAIVLDFPVSASFTLAGFTGTSLSPSQSAAFTSGLASSLGVAPSRINLMSSSAALAASARAAAAYRPSGRRLTQAVGLVVSFTVTGFGADAVAAANTIAAITSTAASPTSSVITSLASAGVVTNVAISAAPSASITVAITLQYSSPAAAAAGAAAVSDAINSGSLAASLAAVAPSLSIAAAALPASFFMSPPPPPMVQVEAPTPAPTANSPNTFTAVLGAPVSDEVSYKLSYALPVAIGGCVILVSAAVTAYARRKRARVGDLQPLSDQERLLAQNRMSSVRFVTPRSSAAVGKPRRASLVDLAVDNSARPRRSSLHSIAVESDASNPVRRTSLLNLAAEAGGSPAHQARGSLLFAPRGEDTSGSQPGSQRNSLMERVSRLTGSLVGGEDGHRTRGASLMLEAGVLLSNPEAQQSSYLSDNEQEVPMRRDSMVASTPRGQLASAARSVFAALLGGEEAEDQAPLVSPPPATQRLSTIFSPAGPAAAPAAFPAEEQPYSPGPRSARTSLRRSTARLGDRGEPLLERVQSKRLGRTRSGPMQPEE